MYKLLIRTVLVISLLGSANLFARENVEEEGDKGNGSNTKSHTKSSADCALGTSKISLDINNVRAMLLNAGDMWWDQGGTGNARYEVPKVDDPTQPKRHSLFAGAIWIGGKDQLGNVLVSAETYRQNANGLGAYYPGPIVDTVNLVTSSDECLEWDKHWKVNRSTIIQFIEDFENGDISEADDVPDEILQWPGRNNPYLANEVSYLERNLAPYVENGTDNDIYDPVKDGDYPDILGDQAIWWILNDVGGDKTLDGQTIDEPIGLEFKTMAFAFATSDNINNMTFYQNTIKNYGSKTLSETYFGQWVDPDLGTYDDDYVGCDVGRGLGICYNGKPVDEGVRGYGDNPPAIGVDFFKGPIADENDGVDNDHDCEVDEDGELITMTKFLYYNNDRSQVNGNPNKRSDFYNYLRNIWRNGDVVTYDLKSGTDQSAPPASYMFPGETDLEIGWGFGGNCASPYAGVDNVKWTEDVAGNDPADRRFLQSAGPFTLKPGAVNEITIGVVWYRAGSGGATGSLSGLKIADDQAQALFDRNFELLDGPDAPDVEVTELDEELVLTLIPTDIAGETDMNTESYVELDNKLVGLGAEDPYYRFQGYLIYQLSGPDVSTAELDNADRARLIAQCDEADGVTKLINTTLDPDLEAFVPELKVDGSDEGIFHTLKVTQDAFTGGPIINYQKYYFMVKAYGYNLDPINDVISSSGQQYLEGRSNVKIYTGMPHKIENRDGGTTLNANVYDGLDITKITGVGNGGNVLSLTQESEEEIVANGSMEEPVYEGGNAPVYVKVYDPLRVQQGEFQLKLFSRLVYYDDSLARDFEVGDTILAFENQYDDPNTDGDNENDSLPIYEENQDSVYRSKTSDLPQSPGKAVIKEIIEYKTQEFSVEYFDDTVIGDFRTVDTMANVIVAKVELVNGKDWGSFMYDYKKYRKAIDNVDVTYDTIYKAPPADTIIDTVYEYRDTTYVSTFIRYEYLPYNFYKQTDPSVVGKAYEFNLNDYWELYDFTNQSTIDSSNTIKGRKRVSEFNEQVIPEYGIAVELSAVNDPQFRVTENTDNGFLTANIKYGDDGKGAQWIASPVIDNALNEDEYYDPWIQLYQANPEADLEDPTHVYRTVLDGMWAPYTRLRSYTDRGAHYVVGKDLPLYKLGNVDIVMTNDQSKWTKAVVVNYDKSGVNPRTALIKSEVQSIDKDGNTVNETSPFDGSTSLGMGWFPGYAVDLDKGRRMNIMFCESLAEDSVLGNNLLWNPTKEIAGSRSYVYVMDSEYDFGDRYEYLFDSAKFNASTPTDFQEIIGNQIYQECMWTGNIRVLQTAAALEADPTRVELRVNKAYRGTEYGETPTYGFNTDGVLPVTGDATVADSALGLIRMVPNPYYAFSEYETSQLDNVVKITNLPEICTIRIYNAQGSLVRIFNKDSDATYVDWDLLNQTGIPISSGAYFAHIEVPGVGEVVVKWFGVLRPLDLDTF